MISYRLLLVTILTVLESNQSSCEDSFLLLCESQTENIFCQNNTAIEIAYASYGYNGNNTFARNKCDPFTWSWNRGTDSTRCHQQGSREILINVCHGRSECDVSASNEVFGDPCPGTSKYLEIFFSCTLDSLSERLTSTPVISQSQSVTTFSDTSSENHQETELDSSALLSSGMFLYEFYALLCEDHKWIISCPNNTVIEIVYATYGYNGNSISARDKCDPRAWFWERGDDSTRCHFEFSSYVLINACNGRPECEVSASSDIFGDPCPGISKYLEIFYDCTLERLTWNPVIDQSHPMINIAYSTTPEDGQEKEMTTRVTENAKMFFSDFYSLLCEDQTETISCPNNTVIEIVYATYGYNGNSTFARDKCDPLAWWWERGTDSTRCHFEFSSDVLITTCNGLSECEVSASSDMFGDPCLGISKYLEIFYNCTSERLTWNQVIENSHPMIPVKGSVSLKDVKGKEKPTDINYSSSETLSELYSLLCEDQTETISCPNNTVIEIVYATYGYNGNSTFARDKCDPLAWWWERGTDSTRCHFEFSSDVLITTCNGLSECEVSASSDMFGDPCLGISKYLEIFYNCTSERPTSTPVITQSDQMTFSDSDTSKGGREEEVFGSVYDSYEIILSERYLVLCEDHKDIIRCPDNNNIKILYASFGYNGNNTSARDQCDPVRWWWERGTDGTMCLQQGSSEILMNACDGRSECAVSASIEVFGDPCPGISKYLDIFYICVLGRSITPSISFFL